MGHIGGDDFIVVTTPDKADGVSQGVINDFDEKIKSLYCDEDLRREYIVTSNRQGQIMKFPLMSISLAVVTNEIRELISHIQISEIAAEVKKKAKSMSGSVYVKDRRKF